MLLHAVTRSTHPLVCLSLSRHKPAALQLQRYSGSSALCACMQVLFGPRDAVDSPVHVSAIGRGIFRTYRFQEGVLKLLPNSLMKKPQPAFTAHTWIVEGLAPVCNALKK